MFRKTSGSISLTCCMVPIGWRAQAGPIACGWIGLGGAHVSIDCGSFAGCVFRCHNAQRLCGVKCFFTFFLFFTLPRKLAPIKGFRASGPPITGPRAPDHRTTGPRAPDHRPPTTDPRPRTTGPPAPGCATYTRARVRTRGAVVGRFP